MRLLMKRARYLCFTIVMTCFLVLQPYELTLKPHGTSENRDFSNDTALKEND